MILLYIFRKRIWNKLPQKQTIWCIFSLRKITYWELFHLSYKSTNFINCRVLAYYRIIASIQRTHSEELNSPCKRMKMHWIWKRSQKNEWLKISKGERIASNSLIYNGFWTASESRYCLSSLYIFNIFHYNNTFVFLKFSFTKIVFLYNFYTSRRKIMHFSDRQQDILPFLLKPQK